MEKSESVKRGEELLRKMAGDAYMRDREERAKLLPDMNELIVGNVFGDIWSRPGLDKRSRSLVMVAVAVGMSEIRRNLVLHIRGALVNGLTKEEILEVILHAAFYTGFPRAATAVEAAIDVFKETDIVT